MRLKRSICAESVSLDRFTDRLSIFNVVDRVSSLGFPLWIPQLALVVVIERDNREEPDPQVATLKAVLDGKVIAESQAFIQFQGGSEARAILNFNLPIPSPGKLILKLVFQHQELDVYDIEVVQVEVPQPTAH